MSFSCGSVATVAEGGVMVSVGYADGVASIETVNEDGVRKVIPIAEVVAKLKPTVPRAIKTGASRGD